MFYYYLETLREFHHFCREQATKAFTMSHSLVDDVGASMQTTSPVMGTPSPRER
jgi:hypothetical protein